MRVITAVLAIVASAVSGHAAADCANAPTGAETFVRSHKVHHFNGDPPSIVEDKLALWKTRDGVTCFLLTTIGPNYHQCEISSAASMVGEGRLVYKQGSCTLTFDTGAQGVKVTASPGWERSGRGGTCTSSNCGMYGEVESGIFRVKK